MKISCPACAAKYSIADEKVSDRLAKIRCRKCGATIVIDGKANPPSVYTAAGEAGDAGSFEASSEGSGTTSTQYTVDFGEGDQRTMSVAEIVTAYNAGQITQDTYLWAEGFADWKPLSEVEDVVAALSPPAAAPSPWAAPAAVNPPRAAARAAARAPAPDLFGSIETAGSEDDVATSAPEHSPQPTGGLGLGAGSGPSTGARNESSVLFSLSALTSAASRPSSRPIAASSSTGAATREDSGLIDLKALTAAATKSDGAAAAPLAAPALGISPLAAPPLGIAAPLGGGLAAPATDYAAAEPKSKTGLFIGGGIAVAAIAAVAIAFIMRPAPPPPPAPAAAAVAPTPTPTPTPTPAPEITAKPPATGTAEAEEAAPSKTAAASKGAVRRPSGGGKKPAAASPAAAPPADDKPAAPKPKKNPCGCAPGDLQCAMRCAAG